MDTEPTKTPYHQLYEQLTDAIVSKTIDGYNEFSPQELIKENDMDVSVVHPETVRALCHYSAVLAGERLGVGIKFVQSLRQENGWVGEGYNGRHETKTVLVSRFIVNRTIIEQSSTRDDTAESAATPKRKKPLRSRQTRRQMNAMTRKQFSF